MGVPGETNGVDGLRSNAQSSFGSAEDGLVRQLGTKMLHCRWCKRYVLEVTQQWNDRTARLQEREERISSERAALDDM